ncbi:hypothetical protein [Rothia aerolata]|uniref:Uncharacterized protein n=1 Tax=Rothia aerolata TaxID=1812262 RepID=A0A917ITT1_9MICC|nr:hypothetical protein [Rothia aerolata]GGH64250.1 hypothetical protein GCM10007359_16380 [Rothia aerolata]
MDYIIAVIPSIAAGLILYFILRSINQADRKERRMKEELQADAEAWYEKVKASEGTRDPFGEKPSWGSKKS